MKSQSYDAYKKKILVDRDQQQKKNAVYTGISNPTAEFSKNLKKQRDTGYYRGGKSGALVHVPVVDGEHVEQPTPNSTTKPSKSFGAIVPIPKTVLAKNSPIPKPPVTLHTTPSINTQSQLPPRNVMNRDLIPDHLKFQRNTNLSDAMDRAHRNQDPNSFKNRLLKKFTNRDYWHNDIKPVLGTMLSTFQR